MGDTTPLLPLASAVGFSLLVSLLFFRTSSGGAGLSPGSRPVPRVVDPPLVRLPALSQARHLFGALARSYSPWASSRDCPLRSFRGGVGLTRTGVRLGSEFVLIKRSSASSVPRARLVSPVSVTLSLTSSGSGMRLPRIAVPPVGCATVCFRVLVRNVSYSLRITPFLPGRRPFSSSGVALYLRLAGHIPERWAPRAVWRLTGEADLQSLDITLAQLALHYRHPGTSYSPLGFFSFRPPGSS